MPPRSSFGGSHRSSSGNIAISSASWFAFLGTVFVMQLPPGPDSMLVIARGIGQGRQVALFTVAGMTFGAGLVQLPLLALGVSALLAASPLAFTLLQWLGCSYLLWIGWRLILAKPSVGAVRTHATLTPLTAAREGMIATLLNPWPTTFMTAFLPQFIDQQQGQPGLQLLLLGLTQKISGAVILGAYAVTAGAAAGWLGRHPRTVLWQQRVGGASIVGLAIYMLVGERL